MKRLHDVSRLGWITGLLLLSACGGDGGTPGNPRDSLTGVWKGQLLGHESYIILQERNGNHLLGYLPADPGTWITEGSRSAGDVSIDFAADNPKESWTGRFSGTLNGNTLSGSFDNGSGPIAVSFTRDLKPFTVAHWLFGSPDGGPTYLFPKIENTGGGFLAGGFVSLGNCTLFTCAGNIMDWDSAGFNHTIELASMGDCPATSTMNGAWDDAAKIMQGDFSTTHCMGVESGPFFGGKEGLADRAALLQVLEMFSNLAEHIEAEATVTTEFSSNFLNDGRTRADWLAGFDHLYANYNDLLVRIMVRQIVTANDTDVHYLVKNPARVQWRLVISGVPEGGGPRETALDETIYMLPGDDDFFWLGTESGRYVFTGNGAGAPFRMDMPVATGDSAKAFMGLWPYGAHGGGHPEGHGGWDVEFAMGAKARAVADGVVVSIDLDPDWNQYAVAIRHRPGVQTETGHLQDVAPGIAVGTSVARGDVIGTAGTIDNDPANIYYQVHFALRFGTDTQCPGAWLSTAGQTVLDTIWATAEYDDELVEPYSCNPANVSFPLTRTWRRVSGSIQAQATDVEAIELTRVDPTTRDYSYTLRDAFDTIIETGTVTWLNIKAIPDVEIDLKPDGVSATHRARIDILSHTMRINWDDTIRPADLSGAAVFNTTSP